MTALYYLSVWLHVLAAAVWIGGMAFIVLVVVPLIRQPSSRDWAASFIHRSGLRFRAVGWVCLALLVVTGAVNMGFRGLRWGELFTTGYAGNPIGRALMWKLILVAGVLVVSAVHDFRIGPRATELWQQDPASPEAARFRRLAGIFGRINALLALAIVLLAVMVARGGWPW
jgi:putative copper export protein